MKSPVAFLLACMLLANAEQPFEADFSPITDAGNYSTFLESVIKTGTDEVISASSPSVTIFGPSDDAFIAISDQIASITDQELVDILLGHVVINASITADVLAKEGCIVATTAQGQNISIYRDPLTGEIDVDGVQVVESISGDFGIFHGLQSVLLPGAIDFLDCPAIPDFSPIVEDGKYGAVLNAMIETNKDFLVAVNMPVTIFGPQDSAFNAITRDTTDVSEALSNHIVIFSDIDSEQIISLRCIDTETVGGVRVAIRYDNTTDTTSINGIPVIDFILGEYGLFMGIDGVLLESDSVYIPCTDFAPIIEAGKYGTLLEAITATKVDALIGEFAPVTIFAPTDQAFSEFQATAGGIIDEELIQRHIILVESISYDFISQIECYETVTTGGMKVDIRYDASSNTTTINGIPTADVGIVGNFGNLHGISKVLVPGVTDYTPCADFSPLVEAGNYNSFLDAVVQTGTNEIISEFSPVTVFAPTDSAFASVQDILKDLSDGQLSENVLFHHVLIYKEIFSAEVIASGCLEAESFGGTTVAVRHDGATGSITVNGIPIVEADIVANFGVVHGLGGILNGTLPNDFIPCPTVGPNTPLTPDQPSASPVVPSTPRSSSASTAFASIFYLFAGLLAMLVS